MFHAFRHYEQFTRSQVDLAITELDTHFPVEHNEDLIRIDMTMLDKITLESDQFEMVVVHLSDDFR